MRKQKGGKRFVFNIFIITFLWIAGIFLLPKTPVQAAGLSNETIIAGVNAERKKIELPALTENKLLDEAAQNKASAIFDTQEFAHNIDGKKFSAWIKESGYSYRIVGENLAVNFTDTDPLFNAWLASPTHKQNILHADYTDIGIAVASGNWQGIKTTIVVTEFGAPAPLSIDEFPVLASADGNGNSREQFVPRTAGIVSAPSANESAPLLTSNLQENYLQSITQPVFNLPEQKLPAISVISQTEKNKTALLDYFSLAVSIMLAYITLMLAVVALYFYGYSLLVFLQKLHFLNQKQYSR
jgi:hypothetical protein